MDFSEIVLSKNELSALKTLKKAGDSGNGILVEPKNKEVLKRLYHFELTNIQACTTAPPTGTLKLPFPRAAYITERGRDYLAYLEAQKREKRSNRRHDILLLFISALIAIFFDHLDDLLNILWLFLGFVGEHQ